MSELPSTINQTASEHGEDSTDLAAQENWRALRFQAAGCRLAASIDGVVELIKLPVYTRLPNVQPWLLGVSNIRGHLVPLFDLSLFFCRQSRAVENQRRLLIIEHNTQLTGLVVDKFEGMRDCTDAQEPSPRSELPVAMQAFVSGQVKSEGMLWHRFDAERLLNHAAFTEVSVYNEIINE